MSARVCPDAACAELNGPDAEICVACGYRLVEITLARHLELVAARLEAEKELAAR